MIQEIRMDPVKSLFTVALGWFLISIPLGFFICKGYDSYKRDKKNASDLVMRVANTDGKPGTSREEWAQAYKEMGLGYNLTGENEEPKLEKMVDYLKLHRDSLEGDIRKQVDGFLDEYLESLGD